MAKPEELVKKMPVTALERFKIQNKILKKFGESGLKIYKEIDGKKSNEKIAKNAAVTLDELEKVLEYFKELGIVEIIQEKKMKKEIEKEADFEDKDMEMQSKEKIAADLEEMAEIPEDEKEAIPAEDTKTEEIQEEEENEDRIESAKKQEPEFEEEASENEIEEPAGKQEEDKEQEEEFEIKPEFEEDEKKEAETEEIQEEEENEDRIESAKKQEPEFEEETSENEIEEEPAGKQEEDKEQEEEFEIKPEFEEDEKGAIPAEDTKTEETQEEEENEDFSIEPYVGEEEPEEKIKSEDSVEKTIRDKYGAIGIAVYTLIDGQKSAEEIMKETGLTESKLVEILDFMEEKGIIKLEYPNKKKGQKKTSSFEKPAEMPKPSESDSKFHPLNEEKDVLTVIPKGMKTIDIPIKLNLDIIKSVQLKAKIMFDFGERGSLIYEAIDGKRNILDIVIKTTCSLEFATKIIDFLISSNAIMLQPITREEILKKYGAEAYKIYKKYGKEGVLLYELIGKDLTIKQMMMKITKNKDEFVEMFIFVHNVLGVPIPVEKEILLKRLE
ncbi:MAG: hypothetical protein WC501_01495 [Candidatus Micrarchaeia archaeon]